MQQNSAQFYKEPFPHVLLPAQPFIHLCYTNLTPGTRLPWACVIPGSRQGMGSDRAARQRFLSSLCREAFCKVTARNPPIMGIRITQPVSRARGLIPRRHFAPRGQTHPGTSCAARLGEADPEAQRSRSALSSKWIKSHTQGTFKHLWALFWSRPEHHSAPADSPCQHFTPMEAPPPPHCHLIHRDAGMDGPRQLCLPPIPTSLDIMNIPPRKEAQPHSKAWTLKRWF